MKPGGRGAGYESVGMAGQSTGQTAPGTNPQVHRQQEEMTEGWDVLWDSPLESKYECPICLMGLREPVQTNCGHRFCRYCILKSIRQDICPRFPIENSLFTGDQIFRENFAKREIFPLRVRFSNKGSKEGMELSFLETHLSTCNFAFVECPLECGDTFWRKDIPDHLKNDCPRRLVKCLHCFKEIPFDHQEIHLEECPTVVRPCEFCQQELTNEQMKRHIANECPRALVLCMFSTVGCNVEKMERRNLAEHLQEFTQVHLRLLLNGLQTLKDAQIHRAGNHSDPHSLPARMTEVPYDPRRHLPLLHEQQTLFLPPGQAAVTTQGSHGPFGSEVPHAVDQHSGGDGITRLSHSMQQMVMSPGPFQPRLGETTWTSTEEREHYAEQVIPVTRVSPYPAVTSPYTAAAALGAHAYAHMEGSSGYRTDGSSVSSPSRDSGAPSQDSGAPRSEDGSMADARALRTKVHTQETRIVEQQHYIRELELKLGSLQEKYFELEEKTKEKMCNGTYIWRIKEYSKLRQQAINGEATVRHSLGFYTSYYGYKLCVRVNLNGVDSAHGTHISLFIHFMMGDNDDILEWPFQGKITLSILDQNSNPNQQAKHITETLVAKPSYAAFQRPTTLRNHKGFGYMEFALLRSLESGQYIKNDTLIIRCTVQPQ
ncbi:TNF receptor-associated factor 6-B-like [Branchiostoma floridae]|uniref:TNF receptor-associated factor 6-B-like n=1 Tax=Branchiostoma floridae TaxID=7739 RepID=A0A9J7L3K9_BRAFL|nr:TNF receptor-associated factor 6-B-like [Branchiostoma floridae]